MIRACRVVGVDVGSVRGKFAWAALDMPGQMTAGQGADPETACQAVTSALRRGLPVALGFEAPLMVPVPAPDQEAWRELGKARAREGNRPWSAGAGSGALATGLVQVAWICSRIAVLLPTTTATTMPHRWLGGAADLLLWEAFVSGPGKPVAGDFGQHAADAAAAASTFAERMAARTLGLGDVDCGPHSAFNLAFAAATMAGLRMAEDERNCGVSVLRTPPPQES